MASELHRRDAPSTIRYYVLTISDTRTEANDTSGNAFQDTSQFGVLQLVMAGTPGN